MANYKTSHYIITAVSTLLASLPEKKYLLSKKTRATDAQYIVINSLPINADVMQRCIVNVNYHVKDIDLGVPDITKLESGSISILNILKKVTNTGFLIDFESQETFPEPSLGEHFSNLRFNVKQINS